MSMLAFNSQDPEKVGPKVEETLRAELELTEPLTYTVEAGNAGATTVGTVLKEGLGMLVGRKEARVFSLVFNLQKPRPARLEINLNRQGIGSHVGSILYSATLSKPVKGSAALEDPKMFGASKFVPDAAGADLAAKLNASKDLLKAAGNFARVKSNVGGGEITAPRLLKIASEDGATLLLAATLPKSYAMGFKFSLDAKEFFHLIELIEPAI